MIKVQHDKIFSKKKISCESYSSKRLLYATPVIKKKMVLPVTLLHWLTNGRLTTPKVKVERGNLSTQTG